MDNFEFNIKSRIIEISDELATYTPIKIVWREYWSLQAEQFSKTIEV